MDDELDGVLALIPALAGKHVAVAPLAGGITNRNYRLDAGGESYVLRLPGRNTALLGIDRDSERAYACAAAAAGIGPEVVAFLPEHAALVTRYVPGRVLAAQDTERTAMLRRVVDALGRVHADLDAGGAFSPFATVREYYALARERRVPFPEGIERALGLFARLERALETDEPPCPCHNDLLPANFIDDGSAIRIIDWEYAGRGDRFFDLGNLAANHHFSRQQERTLLALYFGEVRALHLRRLRLMRLVSGLREAMWGFVQAGISLLDFEYPAYARMHLDEFLAAAETLDEGSW